MRYNAEAIRSTVRSTCVAWHGMAWDGRFPRIFLPRLRVWVWMVVCHVRSGVTACRRLCTLGWGVVGRAEIGAWMGNGDGWAEIG